MDNRCVICDVIIPEGRQVCPNCNASVGTHTESSYESKNKKEIKKTLKEIANVMCAMGDLKKATTITKAIDLINQQESKIETMRNEIEFLLNTLEYADERFQDWLDLEERYDDY